MTYRLATTNDLNAIKILALKSWSQFQPELTKENWEQLHAVLTSDKTFLDLLSNSYSLICENENAEIIGMGFLVPQGNPTEIFDKDWCYIRFVTVDPDFGGKGIGRQLTVKCIQYGIENKEKIIALHTSEIMDKARHIYESLGFKVLREIDQRLGKKYWLYTMDLS